MATADLIFDASTLRYPEHLGVLFHLVEESSISLFIDSFVSVNDKVKLAGDQLRECWLYALRREYERALNKELDITPAQFQYLDQLLSQGIKLADTFQWVPTAEWEAAAYDPNLKMSDGNQRQLSRRPEFLEKTLGQNKQLQEYDPLLLLQSIPEISLLAKRLYQDGLLKFMLKAKGKLNSRRLEEYKLGCVRKAQERVQDLQIISYAAKKETGADQTIQPEAEEAPPEPTRWDRESKWLSVIAQMKLEMRRIASEIETGPLPELVGSTSMLDRANGSTDRLKPFRDVAQIKKERRRLLRDMKAKKRKQSIDASNVTGVQTRSMANRNEKQRYDDSIMQIENGIQNLLGGEDPLGRPLQEEEPGVGDEARMSRKQRKTFLRMRRARKRQKVALRREEVENGIAASRDMALRDSVPLLSNGEGPSSASRNDAGLSVSEGLMDMYGEPTRFFQSNQKPPRGFLNQGRHFTSYEPEMEAEEDVPYVSGWHVRAEELLGVTVKTGTHNKPYADEVDEMDVEMSGRIAKLEM